MQILFLQNTMDTPGPEVFLHLKRPSAPTSGPPQGAERSGPLSDIAGGAGACDPTPGSAEKLTLLGCRDLPPTPLKICTQPPLHTWAPGMLKGPYSYTGTSGGPSGSAVRSVDHMPVVAGGCPLSNPAPRTRTVGRGPPAPVRTNCRADHRPAGGAEEQALQAHTLILWILNFVNLSSPPKP